MYEREKECLLLDIESILFRAIEACRDNIDTTEDLSNLVVKKCQELRYIERDEAHNTQRGDFTNGSCPTCPDVGAKVER